MVRAVERGLARREQKPIRKIGIDEKAFRRGHGYSSLMTDLQQSRVIEVVENRDGQAANALVEITKTGPLEKLVWAPIKDPDNEIKTIHNRTEDPHPSGC